MPLDRPLPDDTREALKMLWDVGAEQQVDIYRHRDSLHKVWHVAPPKPREGMLVYADGTDWNPGSGAGYYVYYAGAWHPMSGGGGGGGGYTIVQDEGVALTVRTTLNFVGAGVTATDDGTRTVVTIPGGGGGAVSSVFTRTGAVIAVTGDYTAAQVTNAVSVLGSYPNPTWIPSYAYSKLTGVPTSFTPSAHVHAAADITTGVMAVARLGTGTPSTANFLRGDGAWTAVPSGSTQTPWLSTIEAAGFVLNDVGYVVVNNVAGQSQIQFKVSSVNKWYIGAGVGDGTTDFTIYDPSTATIPVRVVSSGGVANTLVVKGGNVGVGTEIPGANLAVHPAATPTTVASSTQLFVGEATQNSGYQLRIGYGTFGGGTHKGMLQSYDSGVASSLALNPIGGNVGIGTVTPVSRLHVAADSANPSLAADTAGVYLAYSITPCLGIGNYPGSPYGIWMQVKKVTNDGSSYPLILNPLGGNVGIGTATPTSKLSVVGLPTSTAGLAAGDIWVDLAGGKVLKIV